MSFLIKEFVPEDRLEDKEILLSSFLEIWNSPEHLKYLSYTLKPLERDLVIAWIEHHERSGIRYFCAVDRDERVVGIAVLKINAIDGFELYGLGVRPNFKNQGIGRKLIEAAIDLAQKLQFKAIEVIVFADNSKMLRLVISLGFIPIAINYHKRADGADTVVLKKYLS
ncbi:hypothetical protein AY599_05150 [Leptolyngbya valderiana BDU 20041]|nr:GNAT family N-acetyltransferase [Geitlerinema sp. CS-897]OAB63412.1 hypothetical protein AY599_05150 [Leptolyngbya valderiana BDU 20041]PPT07614.1 hypothetical protein CKA32_003702 [Geitlerinema sp. FC II]